MSLIPLGFWAASGGGAGGGFDLLETTTLTSDASSVTFSGLDAYSGYKHLQIRGTMRSTNADNNREQIRLTFNSSSTGYAYHSLRGLGSSVLSFASTSTGFIEIPEAGLHNDSGLLDAFGSYVIDILDFANSSKNTTTRGLSGVFGRFDNDGVALSSGLWNNTAAVTSIGMTTGSSTNFITGSRFSLYGVK